MSDWDTNPTATIPVVPVRCGKGVGVLMSNSLSYIVLSN